MNINLFLVTFVIILGLAFSVNDTLRGRKWYIYICSLVLLFVAAMRSPEYMTNSYNIDTLVYKDYFENSLYKSWNELRDSWISRYVNHDEESDIGFYLFLKFISLFTHDFYVYSLIADLIFFVPFGIILYRYCTSVKQIIFAFVYYIALIQIYLLGGGRQMIAIGFDMMALLSVINKKKIQTILFFVIGILFHFSSLLFAAPLLMIWFETKPKILKTLHWICFILFPIVYIMPTVFVAFMAEVSGVEKYMAYGDDVIRGGANTFIILIMVLSLFCLIAIKKNDIENNKSIRNFYVMAPLFTFFSPLIRANGTMSRIALYYYLFLALLVPFSIECMFKGKESVLVYVIAIGALAYLTISSGMSYYFFWQI